MEQKKYNKVNLEKKRNLYTAIGLLTALTIVLSAFEYRTVRSYEANTFGGLQFEDDIIEIIPVSIPKAPVFPKKEVIHKIASSFLIDNAGLEEPIEIIPTDFDPNDMVLVNNVDLFTTEVVNEVDPPVLIPEIMPEFPGGITALREYLANELNYPITARREGTNGTVNLSFVVDKDGSITNVKVVHSIGGGCDEEAVRVVEAMPNWKPGKQGGQRVKVQYYLPINFRLK